MPRSNTLLLHLTRDKAHRKFISTASFCVIYRVSYYLLGQLLLWVREQTEVGYVMKSTRLWKES